jgi:ligand-binding sensor domain-containing protein
MSKRLPENENDQPAPDITVKGDRNIIAGRIKAPVILGDIVDSVITFTTSLPPLQQLALLITPILVVIVIILVIFSIGQPSGPSTPVPSPVPDPPQANDLAPVEPLNLTITALALGATADQKEFWVGAVKGSQYVLYRLDTSQAEVTFGSPSLEIEAEITDLMVDCQGNVWMLVKNQGAVVYQPDSGRRDAVFNKDTTEGWLTKINLHAMATRCEKEKGRVIVWLGREGVRTLHYTGSYPSDSAVSYVSEPGAGDVLYDASQEYKVQALYYDAETGTLWAAGWGGQLLAFSVTSQTILYEDEFPKDSLRSLAGATGGVVWTGSGNNLIQVKDASSHSFPLSPADGYSISNSVSTIAVGSSWVWFGGACPDPVSTDDNCRPLGVYSSGSLFYISLNPRRRVNAILAGEEGDIWIGTESGLFLYPSQQNN